MGASRRQTQGGHQKIELTVESKYWGVGMYYGEDVGGDQCLKAGMGYQGFGARFTVFVVFDRISYGGSEWG